jgi:hypothetical protein
MKQVLSQRYFDPFESDQCMADFCEVNSDEFDQWFAENANHPAKKIHYELSFCEAHESRFMEYAYNWKAQHDICAAEHAYDSNKER